MATSTAPLDDQLARARALGGDLRVRVEDLQPLIAERWSEVEPLLRDRWEELEPVVRARWDELEPVVRERLTELEPAARQAQVGVWRALRALFGVLAMLPAVLVRGLRALAGTADEVAERGTQLGGEVRRRRRGRRLSRRDLAMWVGGGVAAGFVAGWVLGRRGPAQVDAWVAPEDGPGAGDPASSDEADVPDAEQA